MTFDYDVVVAVRWTTADGTIVSEQERSMADEFGWADASGIPAELSLFAPGNVRDDVYVEQVIVSERGWDGAPLRTVAREERFFYVSNGRWYELDRAGFSALVEHYNTETDANGRTAVVIRGSGSVRKRTVEHTRALPHGHDVPDGGDESR